LKKRIVILGGGTGGTLVANRLRRRFDVGTHGIHVVDRDDAHVYQPGLLFVPFGLANPDRLVRPRHRSLHRGIEFHESDVERVSLEDDEVFLADGTALSFDVLVVATGTQLLPGETEGMLGDWWRQSVFTFYDLPGAGALRGALERFDGGRLVVNIVDMPIKCPVAPIEFTFLADWYLRERSIRDRTELILATPLDGCFTKPIASKHLTYLLEEKDIRLEVEFSAGEVSADSVVSYNGRTLDYDLLVTIPLHGGADYVARSTGLGDALGFVPTDKHTLQTLVKPNVFALGDATDIPTSKAGSVTHFEGEVLSENVARFLEGDELAGDFDGRATCFIESGNHKALLIDFDYDVEPQPGRLGPLPLLSESRLNHLGKLAFEQLYWHVLLPARPLPVPRRRIHEHDRPGGRRGRLSRRPTAVG